MAATQPEVIVSVIVTNHNGASFLPGALSSALRQTLKAIEVIVVDDASTDDSLKIASDASKQDSRVRIVALATRSGVAAARNSGLVSATGRWIAIFDSGDLMRPDRLEALTNQAEASGADIIADDLLVFGGGRPARTFLTGYQRSLGWVSAQTFISSNKLLSTKPALGDLKPIFRRSLLQAHRIHYRSDLPTAESYDFVVQLLAKGAQFRLVDTLGYFSRVRGRAPLYRISAADIERMVVADDHLQSLFDGRISADISHAFAGRKRSILRARALTELMTALEARNWMGACTIAARNPTSLRLLVPRFKALIAKSRPAPSPPTERRSGKTICLISRQRLVGGINGSSSYLLGLSRALVNAGHQITLICPSPAVFGRWPVLVLRPDMDVFSAIHVRGAWKIGRRIFVAQNPRIALMAAKAVIARVAARVGFNIERWNRPAPYAVAEPWLREDQLFVSNAAPHSSDVILADYAFTTPALSYALNPSARTAVIMHDLFSARARRFQDLKLSDSVAGLDANSEARLLAQAGAVIAIQQEEAEEVRSLIPGQPVLLAPMLPQMKPAPQPGERDTVLFVGSNTAPNIIGLKWLFETVWPIVMRELPECQLLVAGSVAAGFSYRIPGVRFLGIVPDLDDLYSKAGIVISPLTVGSGLKIKLIEALGQGGKPSLQRASLSKVSPEMCSKRFQSRTSPQNSLLRW